jgi:hypothetical protein
MRFMPSLYERYAHIESFLDKPAVSQLTKDFPTVYEKKCLQ